MNKTDSVLGGLQSNKGESHENKQQKNQTMSSSVKETSFSARDR